MRNALLTELLSLPQGPLPTHYRRYLPQLNFLQKALEYDEAGCLIWPFYRNPTDGRARFKQKAVHRIICEASHGPPPTDDHQAAHSCGKGHLGCISKQHLRWATAKNNSDDKIIHGTILRGDSSPLSKLSTSDVMEIRRRSATTKQVFLAKEYGLSQAHISLIISRKAWRHV